MKILKLKDLKSIFDKHERDDVLPICHHVQSQYYGPATQDWHNPNRHVAAQNIVTLARAFNAKGIDVHATVLTGGGVMDIESNEEAGIHPELSKIVKSASQMSGGQIGAGSAYSYGMGAHRIGLQFLMGYNTSQCIYETLTDNNMQPKDATKILVVDGIANSSKDQSSDRNPSEKQVLAEAQKRGWQFTTTAHLKSALG